MIEQNRKYGHTDRITNRNIRKDIYNIVYFIRIAVKAIIIDFFILNIFLRGVLLI